MEQRRDDADIGGRNRVTPQHPEEMNLTPQGVDMHGVHSPPNYSMSGYMYERNNRAFVSGDAGPSEGRDFSQRDFENMTNRGSLTHRDIDIMGRGLDAMDSRQIGPLAGRTMGSGLSAADVTDSRVVNPLAIRNIGAKEMEGGVPQSMYTMASRDLPPVPRNIDSFASRSMFNIVSRELDSLTSRNMDPLRIPHDPSRSVDPVHGTRNTFDHLGPQDLDHYPRTGSQRDLNDYVTRDGNLPRDTMDSRITSASVSQELREEKMIYVSSQNSGPVISQSVDAFGGRSGTSAYVENVLSEKEEKRLSEVGRMNTAEHLTQGGTTTQQSSVCRSELQNSGSPEPVDDIAHEKLSEKVDQIVQDLGNRSEDDSVEKDQDSSSPEKPSVATKFVHILEDHSENFRHQLHQQWLKGQYCDLVVKVRGSEFKVHSCVLAAFSPVLCQMKKNKSSLSLPDIEQCAMSPLIKMMYTGVLCFDLSVAPFVAMAAKRLAMAEVHEVCEEYISECQKAGLSVNDVEWSGVQVTIKKYKDDDEGCMGDSSPNEERSVHLSEDDDEPEFLKTPRRRGRPKRKVRKRISKRGRPLKIPLKMSISPESDVVVSDGDEKEKEEKEMGKDEKEEKPDVKDISAEEGDEDEVVEDLGEEEEDEYVPDNNRRRLWTKRATTLLNWWKTRNQKFKPKHTKRDKAGRLKCPGCSATFDSSDALQNHIENSKEHSAYRCTQCGAAYIRKSNLTRHMRTVHANAFHLKCRTCTTVFKTERELRNHSLEVHNNSNPFECEYPSCNYRTYKYDFLRRHEQIHSDQKDYVCDKCGKTFSQQAGLLSHHRTCYHLQEYLCDICGQAFNHYQSMKSHRRSIHYGERPFMCPECGTRFSDHRNLKRHRRIHENAFPYSCSICGQKYRHSNSLKAHLKKHGDPMTPDSATAALINSYSSVEVEIGSQYSHPHPQLPLPPLPLNHLQEYYANACDKYGQMTGMNAAAQSSQTIPSSMNSTPGLDTLADLCLSSSVV